MYEVRFHGRGGQGAVTAASLLAFAAFREGFDVQSFPHFGVERRGAPVMAFTRMAMEKIDIKTQVYEPDCVIVLDTTLLRSVNVCAGLKTHGVLILNTSKPPAEFEALAKKIGGGTIATVDATAIAIKYGLGSKMAPIVNTAVLGAYSKVVGNVKLATIASVVEEHAPSKKKENANAVCAAYDKTSFEVIE